MRPTRLPPFEVQGTSNLLNNMIPFPESRCGCGGLSLERQGESRAAGDNGGSQYIPSLIQAGQAARKHSSEHSVLVPSIAEQKLTESPPKETSNSERAGP